jgi:hypothetical protein
MTLRKEAPRAKLRWGLVVIMVVTAMAAATSYVAASIATIGPVGTAANFEDNDGNLIVDPNGPTVDWNSFSPLTYTGTAPYQTASKVSNGWQVKALTDAQALTTDTGFAGGTKQDDNCATVKGGKAPNKDDLKRIYLAAKTDATTGHTFLMLAWVRIPQNTTSPSAHVGFEFNQNQGTDSTGANYAPCAGTGHDGLVQRRAGDMLIVYDFEGSSTSNPTLSVRRWITSGSCEISSDSAPCWGPATTLAAGTAEAAVNTGALGNAGGGILDTIAPTNDTLGLNEFGEAGIDLNNAGIFTSTTCTSFGQVEGVSRSSGNSGQAAMEDLVGPGSFTLSNCGTVITRKVTDPAGDTTNSFSFTDNVVNSPATTNTPFSLKDGESNTISNVLAASNLNVTESDPAGVNYHLTSIDCSASTVPAANRTTTVNALGAGGNVTFSIAAGQTLDCTFTNTKNKANPSFTSSPSVIPQDSVSLTSFDTSGDHTGTLTVSLYGASDGTCSSAAVYTKTFSSVANSGPFVTDNSGVGPSPGGYTITADGTYNWKVSYSGDSRNNGFTGTCGDESITVGLVSK